MGRRRDAVLTLLVVVPIALLLALTRPPMRLQTVILGVVGALVLEAASLGARDRVRDYWERPKVQALSVLGVVGVAAVSLLVEPEVLVVLGAGLVTYLVVLVVAESAARISG
ncbi:hypothetical protein [Haloferax larsenii]|nr:hypothetical protein [Haloferax larsenii]